MKKKQNRIIVCIPHAERMFDIRFNLSLLGMQEYFYSWVIKNKREDTLSFVSQRGYQIDYQRNQLVEIALKHKQTHLLFLDTDMGFPRDMIVRMIEDLEMNRDQEVEAITGLYFHKVKPYMPHLYTQWDKKTKLFGVAGIFPINSLFKVAGSGFGCCMVKAEVFKRTEKPWFLMGGELEGKKGLGEDLYFCRKSKVLMLCDTRLRCEHYSSVPITMETYIESNGLRIENEQVQGTKEQLKAIGDLYEKNK
jgi:hypothetical protein